MPEDKIIKSGQITVPRVLFLAAAGAVIVFTVYQGGVFLSIGYWLLTLSICGLLFLIAIDYGVTMDRVEVQTRPATAPVGAEAGTAANDATRPAPAAPEAKPKRRGSRPAKRRR